MTKAKRAVSSLSLRISVMDPPRDVQWALQLGRDELVKPTAATKRRIVFEFAVDVNETATAPGFRLGGPAVQGRPGGRFVYLCIGTYAGQAGTPFGRRAKIGLEGISAKLIKAAQSGSSKLEVEFAGTDAKGEPACATVPLLNGGWRVA